MEGLIFVVLVPVLTTAIPDKRYLLDNSLFVCDNRERIHGSARCDTYNDCSDLSDEIKCSPAWFLCEFGQRTVPASLRCDGRSDCADHHDEEHCGDTYFTCNNGQQILMRYRCDALHNCMDHSDEKNCCADGSNDENKLCNWNNRTLF